MNTTILKRIMIRQIANGYIVQDIWADFQVPDEYAAESVDTVLEIVRQLLTKKNEEKIPQEQEKANCSEVEILVARNGKKQLSKAWEQEEEVWNTGGERYMKVLVGCEESQAVTIAFRERGHDAYSCDLQECSGGHPEWHIQGDIFEPLKDGWDLFIAHPPCTWIAVSGNRYYAGTQKRQQAADFIWKLWTASNHIERVSFENPVGQINKYLPEMPKPQYIQPYQFGHMETKKTGLWLRGLPKLIETNNVYEEMMKLPKKKRERVWYMSPGKNRGKERSKTYKGIAEAMAEQWGSL